MLYKRINQQTDDPKEPELEHQLWFKVGFLKSLGVKLESLCAYGETETLNMIANS